MVWECVWGSGGGGVNGVEKVEGGKSDNRIRQKKSEKHAVKLGGCTLGYSVRLQS